ncbi:MAG: hypothetical protein WDM79_02180 [Terricaulis sp.]
MARCILNNEADEEETKGPFEQDGVGKITDDDLNMPIRDEDLLDAERQLKESAAQRDREQSRYLPGDRDGTPEEREDYWEHRRHEERMDREAERLKEITDRIDEIERRSRNQ